jgi:transposase
MRTAYKFRIYPTKQQEAHLDLTLETCRWSEPLRVDNELSNINSWREVYEKDEAALRPSIQGISSS